MSKDLELKKKYYEMSKKYGDNPEFLAAASKVFGGPTTFQGGTSITRKPVVETPFKMKGSPFQRNFGIGSPLKQCSDGSCPDFSVGGSKFWRGIGSWWQSKKKTWKKKKAIRKAKRSKKKPWWKGDTVEVQPKNPRYL